MSRLKKLGAFIWRWTLRLGLVATAAVVVGVAVAALSYKRNVVDEPGEHISEEYIMTVIARESPVLYRDGRTPIGVFFAQEHRQYVPFSELPEAWVQAITAAEDKRFFVHLGIDPEGIARAMRQNIKAGRVVSGGSTLTQQTAKNIYYRPDRSLRSKWEEMVNALRLERHHSKEKILELYANQFHVSANGRGLGIAARYFFDKEVAELDPLESAFLAGMVKGPANYDPFIARSTERREAALTRAHQRTAYVVDRMLVAGMLDERGRVIGAIDEAEHGRLKAELGHRFEDGSFFNRGQFRYDSHVLLDEVDARLAEAPFPALFQELGIDNPSTAGIQVVTTVDVDAQREATYALWNHLSTVGPVLEALTIEDLLIEDPPTLDPHNPPEVHEFRIARVAAAEGGQLTLALGGASCAVDRDALTRMATTLARARKGERWRTASKADIASLQDALVPGVGVWASLREDGVCDLELRPDLQGAVMVLEGGRIRAMVGGNDNRNFNRAVTAQRQLGSTWKPLIYAAGLHLGWTPVDMLDNRAWGFPFENIWYYPRAAHKAPDFVSLAWAGTHSENLSSIWLLYHLTDRLTLDQFTALTETVGMSRRAQESEGDYLVRIRDDNGVISTRSRYPLIAFMSAKLEIAAELEVDEPAQALELRSLLYGTGIEREEERVMQEYSGDAEARRLDAINNDFLRLSARGKLCAAAAKELIDLSDEAAAALLEANAAISPVQRVKKFRFFGGDEAGEEAAVEPLSALEVPIRPPPMVPDVLWGRAEEAGISLTCGLEAPEEFQALTPDQLDAVSRGALAVVPGELMVDGRISVTTITLVERAAKRRALVLDQLDPYDLKVLQHHPDFRILVGIRYVALMAQRLGVSQPLPPVLSMPLGSTDISLEEAASMYQGILTGQRYRFPGQKTLPSAVPGLRATEPVAAQSRNTQLIAQIRDRDGNVLYRASAEPTEVSDPVSGRLTGGILSTVVQWGTGRRALSKVSIGGSKVPLYGKTGTTNSYRNAAFCGYIPAVREGAWSWDDGFTIAVYVGYDDNRKMSRGSTRLSGASGALPAWIVTAQGLAEAGLLGVEPPTEPLNFGEDYASVAVAEGSGLPLSEGEIESGRTVLIWGRRSPWNDTHSIERRISPLRDVPEATSFPPATSAEVEDLTLNASEPMEADEADEIWIPRAEPGGER